jgi:ATP-dependent Clp protease adaptor protein ClpS
VRLSTGVRYDGSQNESWDVRAVAKKPTVEPARRGDLETLEKPKVERPPLFEVLLHNDDYTTQEFVVYVLERFFHHDAESARQIMLHVHTKGIGVAGVFPRDLAETKVHLVTEFAREHEMPLRCSLRKQS